MVIEEIEPILGGKALVLNADRKKELEDLARPLIAWLNTACHPHVRVLIEPTRFTLLEDVYSVPIYDYEESQMIELMPEIDDDDDDLDSDGSPPGRATVGGMTVCYASGRRSLGGRMTRRLMKVDVADGLFSTERTVSFQGSKRRHVLVVDQRVLSQDRLPVYVISEENGEALVCLPAETFAGDSRVRVPVACLE